MTNPTEDPTPRAPKLGWSEHHVEQFIGRILQIGVVLASAIVLVGGAMLLARHGSSIPDYRVFHASETALRSMASIVAGLAVGDPHAIVALGIVALIATPILRVAFMLVAFALQRDRLYVVLSAIVLALLLYGFFFAS